ncbi:hypothetical protein QUA81_24085 [Microcoleus sp. F6_B4]
MVLSCISTPTAQQPDLNFLAVRLTHFVDRPECSFDLAYTSLPTE